MEELEVKVHMETLRASLAGDREPDEKVVLALVEGALVNLARIATALNSRP